MKFIKKRDGRRVKFDKTKIQNAVESAFNSVDGELTEYAEEKALNIANFIETEVLNNTKEMISVEDIQDMVENGLMSTKRKDVAREYIKYRHDRDLVRSHTDREILDLVGGNNEDWATENTNKNAKLITTQRDYIAGIVSKDIANRYIIPKDVQEAENLGAIYVHDKDYLAEATRTNCFTGDTKIVTSKGTREIRSFTDGETIYVRDKDNKIKPAIVKHFGKQTVNVYTLQSGRTVKTVRATANHRWYLKDGTVTENLQVGDRLYCLPYSENYYPTNDEEAFAWCMGFIVGDGSDVNGKTRVRLCGNKIKHKDLFVKAGFREGEPSKNGDINMTYSRPLKQDFINGKVWRYLPLRMKMLAFCGYYAADGSNFNDTTHKISTADSRLFDFIEECSSISGLYITRYVDEVRNTNFKTDAFLRTYVFTKGQRRNRNWIVKSVSAYKRRELDVYCVVQPETHSFVLDGGIVTGNCCLVNLEDMLQNGTVLNGKMIEKPHRLTTATNISTQIIVAVSSSQYGGVSVTLSHLAPFVNESRQKFIKKYTDAGVPKELADKLVEIDIKREIKDAIQIFNYQVNSMSSTNGQSPFITLFMYLGEAKNEQERDDLALLIEEVLKQRIEGIKNEFGVPITIAFPKLILCLDKYIMDEKSKYHYLKRLSVKCTNLRLCPDYVSEKIMLENKGDVYPPMGKCKLQLI